MTLSANPGSGARPDRHGDLPGADIARHLARHGVNVEVHRIENPGRVRRRRDSQSDRGRIHRPDGDGRVRPRPGARDPARRRDPRRAPAHDGSGAGFALTHGRRPSPADARPPGPGSARPPGGVATNRRRLCEERHYREGDVRYEGNVSKSNFGAGCSLEMLNCVVVTPCTWIGMEPLEGQE